MKYSSDVSYWYETIMYHNVLGDVLNNLILFIDYNKTNISITYNTNWCPIVPNSLFLVLVNFKRNMWIYKLFTRLNILDFDQLTQKMGIYLNV